MKEHVARQTVGTTVMIPFKSLRSGKSRLSPVLSAVERASLCEFMLERTLALVAGMEHVVVISDDDRARVLTRRISTSAHFLRASRPGDLNEAISEVRSQMPEQHSMLVLPTDLLRLDRATLDRFVADPPAMTIAPNRDGDGTNLLHVPRRVLSDFRFRFGQGSLAWHIGEGIRVGVLPRIFRSPLTEFDLDTPDDLTSLGVDELPRSLSSFRESHYAN